MFQERTRALCYLAFLLIMHTCNRLIVCSFACVYIYLNFLFVYLCVHLTNAYDRFHPFLCSLTLSASELTIKVITICAISVHVKNNTLIKKMRSNYQTPLQCLHFLILFFMLVFCLFVCLFVCLFWERGLFLVFYFSFLFVVVLVVVLGCLCLFGLVFTSTFVSHEK